MNAPIAITTKVACWVSKGYQQRDLYAALEKNNSVAVVNAVALYGSPDMKSFSDYIRVGDAEVTVTMIPRDEQTRLIVQSLQEQLTEERVKWHQRQEAILAEISKLQALEYTPAGA